MTIDVRLARALARHVGGEGGDAHLAGHFSIDPLDATGLAAVVPHDAVRSTGGHAFDLTVHHAEVAIGHCHAVHVELAGTGVGPAPTP